VIGLEAWLTEVEDMTMKKMVRQAVTGAMTVAAVTALSGSAYAGPIVGFLGIGGGITYDTVGTTGAAILDWRPTGGGTGVGLVVTDATGYFNPDDGGPLGLDVGTVMTIRDLTNDPTLAGVAPMPAYAPAGFDVSVPNFLSNFTDISDGVTAPVTGLHFDLTERVRNTSYPVCTGTEGEGDTCTLGEIFVLSESEEGLRILLDVRGFFRNEGDEGYFRGAFSTTFTDLTFAEAYARLDRGENLDCPAANGTTGARTSCSFDASFTPAQPIPEPASLLLFGTGSTLLALRRRRNKK
jgi:PEP-CTERM motif